MITIMWRNRMRESVKTELPYEKFQQRGAEALTDAELLAILLRTGPAPAPDAPARHRDCPALALAENILSLPSGAYDGLAGLARMSAADLMSVRGVGEVKAVRILCIFELARRIALARRTDLPAFPTPGAVADYCRPMFGGENRDVEQTVLLLLDAKGRLIHEKLLSMGTVNLSLVSPREIFLHALKYHAVHFLLLHNHPSGDETPSREDAEITKRLAGLGELMQIGLLDHIILGNDGYYSFREAGLL